MIRLLVYIAVQIIDKTLDNQCTPSNLYWPFKGGSLDVVCFVANFDVSFGTVFLMYLQIIGLWGSALVAE